jgi:hypothetical protein
LGDPIDFDLDLDIPPLFTPDLGGGTDVPYTAIGGTEPEPGGECLDAIGPDDESDWFTDLGSAISITGGVLTCDEGSSAINTAIVIGWDDDWQLTAVVDGSVVGAGDPEPSLGVVTSVAFGVGAFIAMYDDGASFDVGTGEGGVESHLSQPFDVQSPMIWTLTRLGTWFFWSITQGANHAQGAISWGTPAETGDLAIRVLSNSESFALSDAQFCTGAATGLESVTPVPGDWTTEFGTITYPDDGELSFADTGDAQAFYDDAAGDVFPFAAATRFRWSGHAHITGTDECFIAFYLMDDAESVFAAVELQISVGLGDLVNFYQFVGPGDTVVLAIPDVFDFVMDWNPDADSLTLWIDGDLVGSVALGTWPTGTDIFPHVWHSEADTMAADLTGMVFVVG